MADKRIEDLREQLNILIKDKADFCEIQRVSQLLDECLVEYYNSKIEKE